MAMVKKKKLDDGQTIINLINEMGPEWQPRPLAPGEKPNPLISEHTKQMEREGRLKATNLIELMDDTWLPTERKG